MTTSPRTSHNKTSCHECGRNALFLQFAHLCAAHTCDAYLCAPCWQSHAIIHQLAGETMAETYLESYWPLVEKLSLRTWGE